LRKTQLKSGNCNKTRRAGEPDRRVCRVEGKGEEGGGGVKLGKKVEHHHLRISGNPRDKRDKRGKRGRGLGEKTRWEN